MSVHADDLKSLILFHYGARAYGGNYGHKDTRNAEKIIAHANSEHPLLSLLFVLTESTPKDKIHGNAVDCLPAWLFVSARPAESLISQDIS